MLWGSPLGFYDPAHMAQLHFPQIEVTRQTTISEKMVEKSSSSSSSSIAMESIEVDLDYSLSHWDFINLSDVDSCDKDSISDGFCSWHSLSVFDSISPFLDHVDHHVEIEPSKLENLDENYGICSDEEKSDDLGFDDDGDDDLDDELVPWSVSRKFGRERLRKLGKRVSSKMSNSKRSPYLYVRAGCVHGKHGLGLKHHS